MEFQVGIGMNVLKSFGLYIHNGERYDKGNITIALTVLMTKVFTSNESKWALI